VHGRKEGESGERRRAKEEEEEGAMTHRLEEAVVVEGDGKGGVVQDGGVIVDKLC